MHYYKSTELAELYGVSRRTVTNWIEQTRAGRLELALYEESGKFFIEKTSKNQLILTDLVQGRRKFLNKRSLKMVKPLKKFYDLYTEDQILDIITNIDIQRELPRQYNYFEGGADYWDRYASRLYEDNGPNLLTRTIKLLDDNQSYLDSLLKEFAHVNVVDVGMGNALPTKRLLSRLLDSGKLKRYIAIDISEEMLRIARKNIHEWFGNKIVFEGYPNDISFEPFADVIAEPPSKGEGSTVNLVLLLGGTLSNFLAPGDVLKAIRKSMGRNDYFVYTVKLDSPLTRAHFDFRVKGEQNQPLPPQYKFLVDLLGIEESYYTVEMGFDTIEKARYLQLRLKHAISIEFELEKGKWIIELNKEDSITVWRYQQGTAFDITNQLYTNGFNPLLTAQTTDHDYMMVLSDLRRDGR